MLKDVVDVRPGEDHRLFLRFEDGLEGTVDLSKLVQFESVFAPLRDHDLFVQVRVNSETGTIEWPNGADLDADVLYAKVSGAPIIFTQRQASHP